MTTETQWLSCFVKRFVRKKDADEVGCFICHVEIPVGSEYTFAGKDYSDFKTFCLECTEHISRDFVMRLFEESRS